MVKWLAHQAEDQGEPGSKPGRNDKFFRVQNGGRVQIMIKGKVSFFVLGLPLLTYKRAKLQLWSRNAPWSSG